MMYLKIFKQKYENPLRQRPEDLGEIVELRYHIGVYGFLILMLYFRSVYVYMVVMFLL
jgi:hypothetical protein